MRYSICREYAAKRAESQNAVELEAPSESFEADVESVVSELRELGMPQIVFGDEEERIKINGELVYKMEAAPMPIRDGIYSQPLFYIGSEGELIGRHIINPLQHFSPPIWVRTPKGLIKNTLFHRNKILERKIQRRLQEDYGEYTKKNPFECLCGKRFKNDKALKKHQGDKKHPNYHPSHTLFDNELKEPPINNIINPDGITLKEVYLMFPNWDGNYKTWFGRGEKPLQDGFNYFNAESQNAVELEAPPLNYNAKSSVDVLRAAMKKRKQNLAALYEELEQRDIDLKDKQDSDIATYGKVLGNKVLMNKIEATERKILKQIDSIGNLQAKIDAKFKLSYRDNKVLKVIRSNDPTTNTASESNYRFDHRYRGSERQRRLFRKRAEESFGAETPCSVMVWKDGALTECGWWNEKNEPCVYHPDGKEINAESFEAEDMITVKEIDWETDGEDIDLPTTMDVPADLEEDEIADYLSDQKGWLVNGFVMGAESFEAEECSHIFGESAYQDATCSRCGKENEVYVEDDSDTTICSCGNRMNGYTGIGIDSNRPMRGKSVCERCGIYDAESFEAAYTPEQRLDDYTPEQLTTSSAVTGDFFEDSLKYSYGGTQAAEEIPQGRN